MIFFGFMIAVLVVALHVAYSASIYIQRFMDCIWEDPITRQRASVMKRIKELCVDADIPEETAILITAKEHNMMEEHVRSALGALNPATMKLAAKGGILPIIFKAFKGLGHFGGK